MVISRQCLISFMDLVDSIGNSQTVFGIFYGYDGQYLLQLISISLVYIHRGQQYGVGLIWTFFHPKHSHNSLGLTQPIQLAWQFSDSSWYSPRIWWRLFAARVLYGSIGDMSCVAGLIWTLLSSQTHPKQCGTDPSHTHLIQQSPWKVTKSEILVTF
jgi:hypothetical protein